MSNPLQILPMARTALDEHNSLSQHTYRKVETAFGGEVRMWLEFLLHTRKNPVRTTRMKLNPLLASDYSCSCRRDITSHSAHWYLLWTSDWIKNTEYVWVAPRRPHSEKLISRFRTTLIHFKGLPVNSCPDRKAPALTPQFPVFFPRMVKEIPHRGSHSRSPSVEQHP